MWAFNLYKLTKAFFFFFSKKTLSSLHSVQFAQVQVAQDLAYYAPEMARVLEQNVSDLYT